ncbi:M15 family metallopeptidase [Baekduia sp. Peel2402]|uniref:M15 family metallopeptidase n=1 Tax=Baekduia sp. Peel2402 TaxID=3458296 RepID=UPI00403E93B7
MTYSQPVRTAARPIRIRKRRVVGLLVVLAAIVVALGHRDPGSSSSATSPLPALLGEPRRAALGLTDGAIPDGTSVFDDDVPGVAKLDPALLSALRQAAADAAADGVSFVVDSGWRSADYQQHLLDEAVSKYGSAAEAARWVATPDTSEHVSGNAVDLGPSAAAAWLSERGAQYGLCRIYGNEPWHFELRPQAAGNGCPPTYADPTHDPRMQK